MDRRIPKQTPGDALQQNPSFPKKLHMLLNDASRLGFEDVICWLPGGISFKILQPKRFDNEIMKMYFHQTKYKSFQRQLNIYGFSRVHHGPLKGGYVHPRFTREHPSDLHLMGRKKKHERAACSTRKHPSALSPEQQDSGFSDGISENYPAWDLGIDSGEQDFLSFVKDELENIGEGGYNSSETVSDSTEDDVLMDFDLNFGDDSTLLDTEYATQKDRCSGEDASNSPDCLTKLNSSSSSSPCYSSSSPAGDDFSGLPNEKPKLAAPIRLVRNSVRENHHDSSTPVALSASDRYFPCKLYIMLEDAEKNKFSDIVSWVEGGTAFKVHKRKEFVKQIMPNYFDQTQFESFRRQLNMYGFSRINKGKDRGVAAHPCLLQGHRELSQTISRVSNGKKHATPDGIMAIPHLPKNSI